MAGTVDKTAGPWTRRRRVAGAPRAVTEARARCRTVESLRPENEDFLSPCQLQPNSDTVKRVTVDVALDESDSDVCLPSPEAKPGTAFGW